MNEPVGRDQPAARAVADVGRAQDTPADRERARHSIQQADSLSAFASDMVQAARAAATRRPPDRVGELRASLIAVTALDLAATVPADAIGVLAMAGQYKRATDLAALVAPESRSDAFLRIAAALKASDDIDAAGLMATQAIEAAESYARESGIRYQLESLGYSFRERGMPEWEQRVPGAWRATGPAEAADGYHAAEVLAESGDIDGAWEAAGRITDPFNRRLAVQNIVVGALARAGRFQDAINAASGVEDGSWGLIADIAAISAEEGDTARTTEIVRSIPAQHRGWAAQKAGTVWARAGRAEDAVVLAQAIDDARAREHALQQVASVLAQTGQIDSAISVWTAAATGDLHEYQTAGLAKDAAGVGDIDGALQIAAVIGDEGPRTTAVEHAACAAALRGDLRRATALVRVIGSESREDSTFAAVAKELAAAGRLSDTDAAIDLIAGTQVQAETLVAIAQVLTDIGDYRQGVSKAEKAVQAGGDRADALIAWARALTLSGEASRAVAVAERAVSATEKAENPKRRADALATWSATLTACERHEEAFIAAERAVAEVESEDPYWGGNPQYWREHRAESVAAILAEAGPAQQAVTLARSLVQDYDRDRVLKAVAQKLAQRGLADLALDALRAAPYSGGFRARDDFREIAQILARHGHGDGALQVAYALADAESGTVYFEYDLARLVRDLVRVLAQNGHVESALLVAGRSRPSWNRSRVYSEIACVVALAGDIERATEITLAHGGYSALATMASALADSGRTVEALPLAEQAIQLVLTGGPFFPVPADAIAMLETLAGSDGIAGTGGMPQPADAAPDPGHGSARDALRAVREAEAITDPEGKLAAQARAAIQLTLTADPALKAQATALARLVLEHAREIGGHGEVAVALGDTAQAFSLAGARDMAAEAAAECLTAAAASSFQSDSQQGAVLAINVLTDIGHLDDALAGLGSLKREMDVATVLCGIAERLAHNGRTGELGRLANDRHGPRAIAGTHERIRALVGLGRVLAGTGEPSLAEQASDMAAEAGGLSGELAAGYQRADALACQARLHAALGRCQEAAEFARRALEAVREPVGGWRGQIVTDAIEVLVRCGQLDEAASAAGDVPLRQRAACSVAVASALLDAGEEDQAVGMVSESIAAVSEAGERQAFYDLVCTQLPGHPHLFTTWTGGSTGVIQISRELIAIERWWN